jgi:hypothetical protein
MNLLRKIILLLLLPTFLYGQENDVESIGHLKNEVSRIEGDIQAKSDTLKALQKKIEKQYLLSKLQVSGGSLSIPVLMKTGATVRKSNEPISEAVAYVQKNDTIELAGYKDGYWIVRKGDLLGYLSELYITETDEIKILKSGLKSQNDARLDSIKLVEKKKQEILNQEREAIIEKSEEKRQAIQDKVDSDWRKKIVAKYGATIAKKLFDQYYWIGMTDEMARISLGEPVTINRSVGSWGVNEQWVYEDLYLYFDNSKLTSYQNSN